MSNNNEMCYSSQTQTFSPTKHPLSDLGISPLSHVWNLFIAVTYGSLRIWPFGSSSCGGKTWGPFGIRWWLMLASRTFFDCYSSVGARLEWRRRSYACACSEIMPVHFSREMRRANFAPKRRRPCIDVAGIRKR